ncbi:MAG: hypothetical protein IPL33_21060 [Sphingobacteriales bacterium]|nr:hypothetical protein [Sphingobacteriales bacterium]
MLIWTILIVWAKVLTATVTLDAGATAGTYSAVPASLVIDAATGAMNIAARKFGDIR